MDSMDKIMEKIALLKNLQERAGTTDEAAAAAGRIQALMFKHNLSEMQVAMATRSERPGYDKYEFDLGPAQVWKQSLLGSVARYNFCQALIGYKGRYGYLVGRPDNIIVTKNLWEYLVTEIDRLADIAWDDAVREVRLAGYAYWNTPSLNARSFKTSFRNGAVSSIAERLRIDFEASSKAEGGSALVVLTAQELKNAVTQFYGKTVSRKSQFSVNDHGAYRSGRAAGRNVNLVNQIGE